MAVQKLVVRHSLVPGNDFNGSFPADDPKKDGIVYSWLDRNIGGRVKFSPRSLMRLERVLLRYQEASTWSVAIQHTQSKYTGEAQDGTSTLLVDETDGGTSTDGTSVIIKPDYLIVSGDEIVIETAGASSQVFLEIIATPLEV